MAEITKEEVYQLMKLKQIGVNHIGLCPYHEEKQPSFTVSIKHQSFRCFGCNKYGTLKELMHHLKSNLF
jgi:DNA primase